MPKDFLESTLEDIIFENQQSVTDRGFPSISGKLFRQWRLPSGKIIDLVSISDKEIQIFELKRDAMRLSGVLQLLEYGTECAAEGVPITLYLVGKYMESDITLLTQWGLKVKFIEYKYDIDGILFREVGSNWMTPYSWEWKYENVYDDFSDKYEEEPSLG